MAHIEIQENRLRITPDSPREVPRLVSAVRLVITNFIQRSDGSLLCEISALPKIFQQLPPPAHRWDEKALKLLEVSTEQHARRDAIRAKVAEALRSPREAVGIYPLLHRLDSHQVEVLAVLSVEELEGLGLFDEQGTGKTISCLCGFDFLKWRSQVDQLLVIAPKSMAQTWASTAAEWFPHYSISVVAGSTKNTSSDIAQARDMLVVTYEAAVKSISFICAWARRHNRRTMLVIDESFFVKNPNAERSRSVAEVRKECVKAVVACGTPAPNSPIDIVHQMDLADMGHTFADASVRTSGDPELISSALQERAVFLRRLKHQVLPGLPIKEFRRVLVPLSPKQNQLYRKVCDELAIEVRAIDDKAFERRYANFLAKRIALLQTCSHPAAVDPSYDEVPAKLRALDILLHDLIGERREKVVLWSFFTHSLDALAQRYSHYGLVRIDGTVTDVKARADAVKQFQNNANVRLFLGNPAAAGAGITLTAARHAVYESLSNQAAHYLQSLDRIHRRGQDRDVEYHILMCAGTLEPAEYERLLRKEERASELLGDPYYPRLTRDEFLRQLETL